MPDTVFRRDRGAVYRVEWLQAAWMNPRRAQLESKEKKTEHGVHWIRGTKGQTQNSRMERQRSNLKRALVTGNLDKSPTGPSRNNRGKKHSVH